MKKQDYFVFQNYCQPIHNNPIAVSNILKYDLLDYDTIVAQDVVLRNDLTGYRLWPL